MSASRYLRQSDIVNADPSDLMGTVYVCASDYDTLKGKLAAMAEWLEANQPDVFRRGLWDVMMRPSSLKSESPE